MDYEKLGAFCLGRDTTSRPDSRAAAAERLEQLEIDFNAEVDALQDHEPDAELEELTLRPRKTDIAVKRMRLIWLPLSVDAGGDARPLAELPLVDDA